MTNPFSVDPSTDNPGKSYTSRIKSLGNAVVPHVVYEIFKAIQECHDADN